MNQPTDTIYVQLSREELEKVAALVELEARPGSPVPSPFVREVLASAALKLRAALNTPPQSPLREAITELIGLHNGPGPDRDARYQDAWRRGVADAQDLLRKKLDGDDDA